MAIIPKDGQPSTPDASRATPDFAGFRPLRANYTRTPNQFFDRVVGYYNPCVIAVVAILIRSTEGWEDPDTGERRIEAELPLSEFVRPELSAMSARRGLAVAIEAGFVVQTRPHGPRQAACYALRWDDADAQKRAILKQRAAQKAASRGNKLLPLKKGRGNNLRPLNLRPLTESPPTDGTLKETNLSGKKRKNQESVSPAALEERKARCRALLPPALRQTLEARDT